MKNMLVGTKLDPKVKVGNGYFKTVTVTAENIKKKVDSKLKGMIKVQVFFDSNGEKYRIPTWSYFTKKQLKTKKIQLRTTSPYILKMTFKINVLNQLVDSWGKVILNECPQGLLKLIDDYEDNISDLEREVEELEKEVRVKEIEVEDLELKVNQLESDVMDLENQLETLEKQLNN